MVISGGVSLSWADDNYMQGYFGVNDSQATRSGYAQFNSQAGLKDVGLQLRTQYALTKHWNLEGQIGVWRMLNDAADSPIVKNNGTENQMRGLVGMSYNF